MAQIYAKIRFKSTLGELVNDEGERFDLLPIISTFGQPDSGFLPKVVMLIENPNDPQKPPEELSYTLSADELISGQLSCNLVDDKTVVVCDGVFKLDVKPAYTQSFLDPRNQWAYAGPTVSQELTNWEYDYGVSPSAADMNEFKGVKSYSYFNKRLSEEIRTDFMIIDVQTSKSKTF
jgi:hypothetical protein